MCDFSDLIIGNYQGFTWQASEGKAAVLPSTNALVSVGSLRQELRYPWPVMIFISIASPSAFIPKSLI